MAKIARVFQKIFGVNAGLNQRAVFGSLAASAPAFSTDPATIQSLANFTDGWFAAVIGGNSPAIEDMNALQFLYAYQLAYLMQAGVAEWDTDTVYYEGSFVSLNRYIYVSLTDDNSGNLVTDTTNWRRVGGDICTTLGDLPFATTTGTLTRLPGNVSTTKKILTQTGTGVVSAAPSWDPLGTPNIVPFAANGTYTPTAGCLYSIVKLWGGGGGGGGSGSAGGGTGNTGGASAFGSIATANGGVGGSAGPVGANGGAGGSASISASPGGFGGYGANGQNGLFTTGFAAPPGGNGAATALGGNGKGGTAQGSVYTGGSAQGNTGSGGGGASAVGPVPSGGGGGGGAYCEFIVANPTTVSVVIGSGGTGGTAGTSGNAGGSGGSGYCIVEEYFQ